MKHSVFAGRRTFLFPLVLFTAAVSAPAAESPGEASPWDFSFRGMLATEGWYFPAEPLDSRQKDANASAALELEMFWENREAGRRVTFIPFGRMDYADPERTHADIRELNLLLEYPDSDLLVGVGKVFWGTTDAVHWVDVVNQTDLVEDPDQEARLGQPMINYNRFTDLGRISFFVLPGFRERTFPGSDGRLRTQPRVIADAATYSSSREEWHIDFATRWSHTLGNFDLGLSHFWGTVREPVYRVATRPDGEVVLHPHYDVVHQFGLDGVWFPGDWLVKFELMSRHGQGDSDFFRFTGGPEYTFFGAFGTRADIDVFTEILYDSQSDNDINPFERDLAYGFRFRLNDLRDTTFEVAAISDLEDAGTFLTLEASRRAGQNWILRAEARAFAGIPADDFPLNGLRRDHHLRLIGEYRF